MIFTSNKETDYLILNKLGDDDLINFFKAFPENNCCRSEEFWKRRTLLKYGKIIRKWDICISWYYEYHYLNSILDSISHGLCVPTNISKVQRIKNYAEIYTNTCCQKLNQGDLSFLDDQYKFIIYRKLPRDLSFLSKRNMEIILTFLKQNYKCFDLLYNCNQ